MKLLKKIFQPSAFKLGLIFTVAFMFFCFWYYYHSKDITGKPRVLALFDQIHQKSIDLRLLDRGYKPVSDAIALITVDEESLEKIGQWPWRRNKIAEVIEVLMKYNAKVVAFDTIFSEPESNAKLSLNKIKNSGAATKDFLKVIDDEIQNTDNDEKLGATIAKYADRVVMGSYFDVRKPFSRSFKEICYQYIERSTNEFNLLQNEENQIIATDRYASSVPDPLESYLSKKLGQIKNDIESQNKNLLSTTGLVLARQQDFCHTWLLESNEQSIRELEKLWPEIKKSKDDFASLDFRQWVDLVENEMLIDPIQPVARYWINVPSIAQKTKFTGYFNASLDTDGTIRHSPVVARFGGNYLPSLALRAVMTAIGASVSVDLGKDEFSPAFKEVAEIKLADLNSGDTLQNIPIDNAGNLMINYYGPNYKFPHLSVAQLLSPGEKMTVTQLDGKDVKTKEVLKAEFIKNKIFFFGATAVGIYDLRVTPFDENFPGLETHANVAENILTENYLHTSPDEKDLMLKVIVVLGLLLSYIIATVGATWGLVTTIITMAIVYVVDKFYFFSSGVVVTIVLPFFLVGVLYIILTFYKYLTEERKKQELKGTFQKYVSPAIVNEILANPQNIELGGKKQRMSVMFSDVRGFTTIAEKLDPRLLSQVLSEYLTPMTRLVFEYKGTLDKYMGDAIMAFFGAPIQYKDHAKYACLCALKMMEKLSDIQKEFEKKGFPRIDIGIGINTGDMSVGNMGSDIVRSYTVMGDAVNLGSRLEGITKQYGVKIIISEFTYEDVKNDFICREVDWVRVKGKLQPVKIYELISNEAAVSKESAQDFVKLFQEGTQHYHKKDWNKAIVAFNGTLNIKPSDYASQLYIERCQNYIQEPPKDDWDGVFEMKTK